MAFSSPKEIEQKVEMHNSAFPDIPSHLPIYQNAKLQSFLDQVMQRVVVGAPEDVPPKDVVIVDRPEIYLGADHDHVYISRGLLGFLCDEDEVATMLAYQLADARSDNRAGQGEFNVDRMAVKYLINSGFNSQSILLLWQRLDIYQHSYIGDIGDIGDANSFWRKYKFGPERVAAIESEIANYPAVKPAERAVSGRSAYLAVIDGLPYGDEVQGKENKKNRTIKIVKPIKGETIARLSQKAHNPDVEWFKLFNGIDKDLTEDTRLPDTEMYKIVQ
ncbi:MAG: hypothetical protein JNK24_04480 [Alphaproteobacteria bacterium]|nr:hypothetical protein [Alphaproteobacteria bacterium]